MDEPTIIVIIDALGFDLVSKHGFHPHGLERKVRLETVLGFSQAALTSIFTGLRPDQHGLWAMYSFESERSPFRWLRYLPGGISSRRLCLRRLIRWKLERVHGVSSYYSLYSIPREILMHLDLPARANLFDRGGVEGCKTILDVLEEQGASVFVRDYRTSEERAFDELEEAVKGGRNDFYILYTAGLDSQLHECGTGDGRILSKLNWYGERIDRLLVADTRARMFVFGDHGFSDVTDQIDLISQVESLSLRVPGDYIPFYDSTMARFKIMSGRAGEALKGLLQDCHKGRILEEEELEDLGLSFGDNRYGDIIFLLDPGKIIVPSFMSNEPVAGMHGYHPDSDDMYSVMFTNASIDNKDRSICDVADIVLPGFKASGRRKA